MSQQHEQSQDVSTREPPTERTKVKKRSSNVAVNHVLPRNVCLFCYRPDIKNHLFKRQDGLRNHYRRVHFQYQPEAAFWCPVPGCKTIIDSPDHFCNHAKSAHRSDIGVRASIMKSDRHHKAQPGQLQTFMIGR